MIAQTAVRTVPVDVLDQLCGPIPDGYGKPPTKVSVISFEGLKLVSSGGLYSPKGREAYFNVLGSLDSWERPTTEIWHDEKEINSGRRKRGDKTGVLVSAGGKNMVITGKLTLKAGLPTLRSAATIQEVRTALSRPFGWLSRTLDEGGRIEVEKVGGLAIGRIVSKEGEETRLVYYKKGKSLEHYRISPEELVSLSGASVIDASGQFSLF